MESEEGVAVHRRAEIDTRAPFRSVKEAVVLFGEKVLAGELYASKLKEMRAGHSGNGELGTAVAELEETKQSLEKAREEGMLMANCLSSLEKELKRTKMELEQLKERESEKRLMTETEIEDVKFVEDSAKKMVEVKAENGSSTEGEETSTEFQKKRYVTFANPTSVAQFVVPQGREVLERHPSLKKKKKKPLIPFIGGLFFKRKGTPPVPSPATP